MSVLADYYKAQIRELNGRTNNEAETSDAQARLANAQRSVLGGNAEAQQEEARARAQAAQAGAGLQTAQAGQLAANDASLRAQQGAATSLDTARAQALPASTLANNALTTAQAAGQRISNYTSAFGTGYPGAGGGGLPLSSVGGDVPAAGNLGTPAVGGGLVNPTIQGDETGGRVLSAHEAAIGKAKKPGPTDTVPAMLTPGEAVLNKGAVSHYGSDVIDHMNKMGLMKMAAESELARMVGAPDPHAPPKAKGKAATKAAGKKAAA